MMLTGNSDGWQGPEETAVKVDHERCSEVRTYPERQSPRAIAGQGQSHKPPAQVTTRVETIILGLRLDTRHSRQACQAASCSPARGLDPAAMQSACMQVETK